MHLSVLLPVYNAEPTLQEAIESVLSQTHRSFELLIVNDGSTDGSDRIVRQYAEADDRIRSWHQPNRGMAAALNHMIREAKSDWLVRMDADDVMLPHRLERQVAFIEGNSDIAVASCLPLYINAQGREIGRGTSDLTTRRDFDLAAAAGDMIGLCHPGVVMRKAVVSQVGGYRHRFWPADDIDLWNRISEKGFKILVQPEYLLRYRIHQESVSIAGIRQARERYLWVKACASARRTGKPEPSLAEFRMSLAAMPWWRLVNQKRKDAAKVFYKRATIAYSGARRAGAIANIIGSVALQPTYALRMVSRRYLPWAARRVLEKASGSNNRTETRAPAR